MANAEIECIVRDTRELMYHIGSGERRVDDMIRRVNTVMEKMACMREYQNIISAVNAYTINGSRRSVLLEELQRENRQIQAYHEENRNLREAIDESMETLSKVMARHRMVMARMARACKQPPCDDARALLPGEIDDVTKDKERFRKLVSETSDFMRICEDRTATDLQQLSQLLRENEMLKEMLSTAAISSPNVKHVFAKAVADWRAHRNEKSTNGEVYDSDDDSANETDHDATTFEVKKERTK